MSHSPPFTTFNFGNFGGIFEEEKKKKKRKSSVSAVQKVGHPKTPMKPLVPGGWVAIAPAPPSAGGLSDPRSVPSAGFGSEREKEKKKKKRKRRKPGRLRRLHRRSVCCSCRQQVTSCRQQVGTLCRQQVGTPHPCFSYFSTAGWMYTFLPFPRRYSIGHSTNHSKLAFGSGVCVGKTTVFSGKSCFFYF